MHARFPQSYPTLCEPVGCSPPDCSVHGILQPKILKWVAISPSIYFCFIDFGKAFDCGSQQTVENSERWNTRQFDMPLEKPVHRSGRNS